MPRIARTSPAPTNPAPAEEAPGAALLASLGPEKKKRRRAPSDVRRTLARDTAELDGVIADPGKGEPRHLVALYAYQHERVYGVFPEELVRPNDHAGAVSAARSLLSQAFDGDMREALEFMRWVWQEQRRRAAKKRANGETPFRVGWRLQFVDRRFVTDYRAAMFEKTRRTAR
jgi:hypothetical protein